MAKLKRVGLILFVIVGVAGIAVIIIGYLTRPQTGKLTIEAEPVSEVLIDGEPVGKTPMSVEREARELTLKLIPESFDGPLIPYETRVKIESGVETIVRRKHGEDRAKASGSVISFEKIPNETPSVAVVTTPDGADVIINEIRYSSPIKVSDLPNREHTIEVSAPGYSPSRTTVIPQEGYLLTLQVDLEKNEQAPIVEEVEENPELNELEITKVLILDTPVGFLRVRSEPTTGSERVAEVDPGEEFDLLGEDENESWYKIKIDNDTEGWVSAEYASKSAQAN